MHEKLSNARQDFLHKLSRKITDENSVLVLGTCVRVRKHRPRGQVVVVENLNIKGMVKNRKLSQAITQSGRGMFLNFLDYKLKHKGGVLVEIDRFFPSSKLCSNCGHKYEQLQLNEREWICEVCQTKHLRDENAAKNIRLEGMRVLGLGHSPHGDGVRLQACSEATVYEVSTTPVA